MTFKEYLLIIEIGSNYGLEPQKQDLDWLYTKYKQPVGGAENSDKPPTPTMTKKLTKRQIFNYG